MRQIFLGVLIALTAGCAMASSIDVIGNDARTDNGSIIKESCQTCPPLVSVEAKKDYVVPTLAPGAWQSSQIRDLAGVKKLYRTEGWMGGSPVVFVTKAPAEPMIASTPKVVPAEGIDLTSTTAAVVAGHAKPIAAGMAGASTEQIAPLDVSSYKLRF
jgi:hypothetical protein